MESKHPHGIRKAGRNQVFSLWKCFAIVVVTLAFGIWFQWSRHETQGSDDMSRLIAEIEVASQNNKTKHVPRSGYRVMAEYGSSGIWKIGSVGPFRHAMMDYSTIKLSNELSERFTKWIAVYEGQAADLQKFNADGLALAMELKKFLGSGEYVEFQGEGPNDELLDAVPINMDNNQANKDVR
jgi:hypothetical protein